MVRIGFSDTPVASNDPRLLQDDVVFDFASQDVVLKNKRMQKMTGSKDHSMIRKVSTFCNRSFSLSN